MTHAKIPVRVERVVHPATEVSVFELVRPDGSALPAWEPGAHVDLHLPSGLVRQYSLCGDPANRRSYRLGILRDTAGRGGSLEACDKLAPGTSLSIGEPRNHFPLKDAEDYVFVAGGIGITPILTMVRAAQRANKPWQLVYGGRTRASMAFLDEIAQYAPERVRIVPQDKCGLIDLGAIVDAAGPGTAIYSCGPAVMLTALEQVCDQAGKRSQLHVERFSAPPSTPQDGAAPPAHAFKVELAKSGFTLDVAADRSLKSVLQEAGISVPFSCEEGYCGSCETAVLSGEPEHHDCVLSPEEKAEGKFMMVCVGRCRSERLVLDL